MRFIETKLEGLWIVEPERREDERGFFARTYCRKEFGERGLCEEFPQCSTSFNRVKGTLHGMHFQKKPHGEIKLVRCTMGAIYDVTIDLRPGSPTLGQWVSRELTAENRVMMYVPKGFAHGFVTLEDHSEVFYQMSEFYHPESASGVCWNDPAFGIAWPFDDVVLSEKDRTWPLVNSEFKGMAL